MENRAIGVFDSGLGGLTVVKEIMKLLPNEKIVYFGDTARVPYGSKSEKVVVKYSKETGKLQIVELTPEQKEQWKKAMSVVYPQFYDVIGEDLIKKAIDTK